MSINCRVCKSPADQVLSLDRVPPNVQALLKENQLGQVTSTTFKVYQCNNCGLVQSPAQLSDHYYDDYLMSTTFSQQLGKYLDELVEEFVNTYGLQQGRILDVGCGDGAFMYPFKNRNIATVGIEPSDRSREVAKQAGFEVYGGYMNSDTVIPTGPFDAFVSRQVLEHVDDIQGMLTGLKRNLKSGAVGIIEVPRLEKALENQRFYDFFPDHINYYSLESLRNTLEFNGFRVLELRSTMFDEYNVAIVQFRTPTDFAKVMNNANSLVADIDRLFTESKEKKLTTAVWGAGAKGLSILTSANTDNIDHLVDSDANKQGRYTPISELLIEGPEVLTTVDVLLITAVAYQDTIIKKLKDFTGNIYVLEQTRLKKVI
jgi:2-polyprenyl-3-methyl-5-hydroxy-6-metoxy-1,4-benzoquinol methylase